MSMSRGFRAWLGGIISAFCSGVTGGIAAMGFDPIDFNFEKGFYKLAGMSMVVGAIGVVNFLSRSPLWTEDETTTTTVSTTTLRSIESQQNNKEGE